PLPTSSLFVLFILLSRPPLSTLFPYTTLFRSEPGMDHTCLRYKAEVRQEVASVLRNERAPDPVIRASGCRIIAEPCPRQQLWCVDRKSTRLNSSHQIISYAVFCLKKKNKTKAN